MKNVILRFMACSDLHYSDNPECIEKKRFEEGLRQLYAYADSQPYSRVDAVYIVGDFATSGTLTQRTSVRHAEYWLSCSKSRAFSLSDTIALNTP